LQRASPIQYHPLSRLRVRRSIKYKRLTVQAALCATSKSLSFSVATRQKNFSRIATLLV
jgi:hypothetical protein